MKLLKKDIFETLKQRFEVELVCGAEFFEEPILNVVPLEKAAQRDELSFLFSHAYVNLLRSVSPGLLVVEKSLLAQLQTCAPQLKEHCMILACTQTSLAMIHVLKTYFEPQSPFGQLQSPCLEPLGQKDAFIHSTAVVASSARVEKGAWIGPYCVVEEGARIQKGTRLLAFVYVGKNCKIGKDSVLFPHVTLYPQTELQDRVRLHAGVVLGTDGFGYVQKYHEDGTLEHVKIPHLGKVVVESDVEIGAQSCVDRATLGETRIGKAVKIDNLVQIGHNTQIGEASILCGCVGVAGSTKIGKGVFLGAGSGVKDGTQIGDGAQVGAYSAISKNVAHGKKVLGYPARDVKEFFKIQAHLHQWVKKGKKETHGKKECLSSQTKTD